MLFRTATAVAVAWALGPALALAQDTTSATDASPTSTPSPTGSGSSPCASISTLAGNGARKFPARVAYDCLKSIPLNKDDSMQWITYLSQYLQFLTTSAYLKNPPSSYQQPPVDVFAALKALNDSVASGSLTSQYDLDFALYQLENSVHDDHVNLQGGTMGLFNWYLDPLFELVSVSADGQSLPKIYALATTNDLDKIASNQISAIQTIEGQNVVDYLTNFASNNATAGTSDPNSDWNYIMFSPAMNKGRKGLNTTALNYYPFYRGDSLKGTYENGTAFEWQWVALSNVINATTVALGSSPDAIYNNYVVVPSGSASPTAVPTATDTPSPTALVPTSNATPPPFAYPPVANVTQQVNGENGLIMGYLNVLRDSDTAVLSLPTFQSLTTESFSKAVEEFLNAAKKAGAKKIVVDLQGNGGGDTMLGFDIFKQFFPHIEPYGASRIRANQAANTLGKALSFASFANAAGAVTFPPEQIKGIVGAQASPYDAIWFLNSDGNNFTSWGDFFGPRTVNGDLFTNPERNNLSNTDYTMLANGITVYGYGNRSNTVDQPFAAKDIVILTDGFCGSTCSIFSELMKTEAGVKFVVAGGRPTYGPMQAVSGTRGTQVLTFSDIDQYTTNIRTAVADPTVASALTTANISSADLAALPPPLKNLRFASPFRSSDNLRFNARDAVRRNSDVPLQFIYQAADCRVFYTPAMLKDYTVLWQYAADAVFTNSSLCVQGSINHPTAGNITSTDSPGNTNSTTVPTATGNGGTFPSQTGSSPSATTTKASAASGIQVTAFFSVFAALLVATLVI